MHVFLNRLEKASPIKSVDKKNVYICTLDFYV